MSVDIVFLVSFAAAAAAAAATANASFATILVEKKVRVSISSQHLCWHAYLWMHAVGMTMTVLILNTVSNSRLVL